MQRILEHFNFFSNREALTIAKVGEWQYDVETDETFLSDTLYDIFEIEKKDTKSRSPVTYYSLVHPDDLAHFKNLVEEAISGNKSYHAEHRLKLKCGRIVWVLVVGHPVTNQNGKVIFLRGIAQDITQYKLDHERLQSIETLFHNIATNVPGLIYQFMLKPNGDMSFPFMSAGACQVYEVDPSELVQKDNFIFTRVHPDDVQELKEKIHQSAKNLSIFNWEGRFHFPENRIKWVQATSAPRMIPDGSIMWEGLMMDITEKRVSQEMIESQRVKMISSSKLASLGEMAAGVAHEINNPLTIIRGRAIQIKSLFENGKQTPEVVMQLADKIMETVDRAAKIVRSLRHFARDSEKEPEQLFFLRGLIQDTLELCSERFKYHRVELEVTEFPEALALFCRPIQISQVLLNLLNNSLDAVLIQKNSQKKWVRLEVKENDQGVQLIVTDSGDGVPEKICENIFMPFFTTKELGKGTGLGLSLSFGIVKEHGGKLYLNSASSPTQFIAQFPKPKPAKALAFLSL